MRSHIRAVLAVILVVFAAVAPAQVGTLQSRWQQQFFKRGSYTDRVSVTGAGGANPLTVGSHYYPYYSYPVPSTGDAAIAAFGNMAPFLTGISQFAMDPVNNTGANITTATLASGGLVITKTGAFSAYTPDADDYVKVNSGTGAVVGYYPVSTSGKTNDQITLTSSAGAGGGASDLSFTVIRPNNDPIAIGPAYNYTNVAGLKSVATEYSAAEVLETNYLVDKKSTAGIAAIVRTMERYFTLRAASGNPGNEIRPHTLDYDITNHKIIGQSMMAADQLYGAQFSFRKPNGGAIDTGTEFMSVGWANTGGGALNGIQHLGHTGEDTLLDIQAPTSKNSKMQLGSGGTAGAFKVYTASTTISRVDVGSSSNGFQWAYNDGGMSVGINDTGNLNGLAVKPMSNAYATIRGYSLSGQTLPAFQAWGSGGAQTAGMYAENGAILSKSTGGVGYEAGAGGTVTQTGFRTSGVTINKTTGAITLVSASGSTTPTTFTVTNSTVAATDVIVLNQKSGTDLYVLLVTNVGSGTFKITAYTTGGTTSEQPVINFAVIKGASS